MAQDMQIGRFRPIKPIRWPIKATISKALSQLNIPVLVLAALFLAGCAATEQPAKRRYFWPFPPDEPKIEFLGAYWGQEDMPKTGYRKFLESMVGGSGIMLDRPWGIASDGKGKVYVTDLNVAAVLVFDFNKNTVSYLGGEGILGTFDNPIGIALDASGNIYVSDAKKGKVFVFTEDGKPLRTIGDKDTLTWPVGMAIDDGLGRLYVANVHKGDIAVFDLSGKYIFSIGRRGTGDGEFNFPQDVALDSKGNIVVSDSMNARIQIMDKDGRFIRKFGQRGDSVTDLQLPKGIAVSRDDNIYVVDGRANMLKVFGSNGESLTAIGGAASYTRGGRVRLNPGGFLMPTDVYIDRNEKVYVAEGFNMRFQVFQILNEEYLKENPIRKDER